jgi:small subunit ribosomal protein S20
MRHKTKARTLIKEIRTAANNNDSEKANETLKNAVSVLQKTASKGVIHKNKASRTISRLARQVNRLTSEQ